MILNRYIITNLFLIIIFYLCGINVSAQNQSILIFDPHQVSTNFQSSFHQLSSDSLYIVDSLDENINNFDALFLFIGYPYVLSEEEGNRLIEYLNLNKPIYFYNDLSIQYFDLVGFWNYIGFTNFGWFPILTTVDRVSGVDTTFTKGIVIDTSFISGNIPGAQGNISPILTGISDSSISLTAAFIPADESIKVIIDLYNLIHHSEFLERVLIHFGLEEPNSILDENADQPITFYLHQNYPNPFNPITSIQYAVSSRQFVSLKVYDVLGNEIASLVDEEKPVGSYEIKFDGTGLTSGIYFYRIQAGDFVETKKMVLMK